ncbi:MAG: thioredoxin [Hyphomicrobiaceae bacterium]|nr:MAG: thioredoxin [Hyphomicrobiaceae bacterium]
MKTSIKILIVSGLAVAVIAAVELNRAKSSANRTDDESAPALASTDTSEGDATVNARLPKLLDLGADKCIPCKMMAPVLEELRAEYAGRMNVEFVDVWKRPEAGRQYGVEMIPTQIFFDADGNELFRHVGFFGREDILGKWNELGVDLSGKPAGGVVPETATNPISGNGSTPVE